MTDPKQPTELSYLEKLRARELKDIKIKQEDDEMSMNLAFENPKGEYIDFPFQTPTKLTRKVVAESNTIVKLQLIKEYLEEEDWIEEDMLKILFQIRQKIQSGCKMIMV